MSVKLSSSKIKLNKFNPKEGYDRGAGKLKEVLWYLIKVLFFLTSIPYPNRFKLFLLRAFGAKIGKGIVIKPRVNFHMPWRLAIGDYSWIGEEVFILNFELIEIGNNVCISQRVFICGGNHDYNDPSFRYLNGPVIIGDGVWIGAGSFIGPNLNIGYDTVVGAGSVVTKSLGESSIYKGNPPVFVKKREIRNEKI